ncbi:MAG: TonB-dependent receptor [Roseibium album]|uniref:TonB-dependent receptor n=1 Tax=Roseibium album TaxID=311410 RepID=UPI0032EB03E3
MSKAFRSKRSAHPLNFKNPIVKSLILSMAAYTVANSGSLAVAQPGGASDNCSTTTNCRTAVRGKAIDDSSSGNLTIGENTERETLADEAAIPFVISVDGEVVDESSKKRARSFGSPASAKPVDRQRKTDVDLDAVDIQVKFDGLDQRTLLNVSTSSARRAFRAGETVEFLATANYPAFIVRAEIQIFDLSLTKDRQPLTVLPVNVNETANWTMPDGGAGEFGYVLRVYDRKGRFDETEMLSLVRFVRGDQSSQQLAAVAPGMAEDRTAVRNIPVYGGAITVFGRNVPPGYGVEALGDRIPIDKKRSFVVQRILPPGDHTVDISVVGSSKSGALSFSRLVSIPANDWFYVALADLTLGKRFGGAGIEAVRGDEYDRAYVKGGLSFYLKGKIRGSYLLTVAADIQDDDWENILRNTTERDPQKLLERIDPDQFYPVYGDDSITMDDAPTDGKLYVRLERGGSHVMWGNYKTEVTGTEFLRSQRSLYGGSGVYRSEATTSSGEHRVEVSAYVAQPGTLSQQDVFLATGGAAYFLKRQDVSIGSATVSIEVRDPVTNRVIERQFLDEERDYTINYLQGLIILAKPLSPTSIVSDPVRDGALDNAKVFLVVQYEFTPTGADIDGYTYGARVQGWVSDKLRLGLTGGKEKADSRSHDLYGTDFIYYATPSSYVEGEFAQSDGIGLQSFHSTDGGLTFSEGSGLNSSRKKASAWRLRGALDLEDLGVRGLRGKLQGGYEERGAGFSTLYEETNVKRQVWDVQAEIAATDEIGFKLGYKELRDGAGQQRQDADFGVWWQVNDQLKFGAGASHTQIFSPAAISAGKFGYDGSRLDGGVRAEYNLNDDLDVYAFGQGTLVRSGDIDPNNRAGIGGRYQLTEKIGVLGEISHGTHGIGGAVTVNYDPSITDGYYVGYRLDPYRAYSLDNSFTLNGADAGTIVMGSRTRISETTTVFSENNYDMFGRRKSLTQTYGVEYTPNSVWGFDSGLHLGSVKDETIDPVNGKQRADFDRKVASAAVRYREEEGGLEGHVRGEVRFESSEDNSRDATSYFFSSGLGWNVDENWRTLASLEGVLSESRSSSAFLDGNYLEASLGYAYRPIHHDRLNALFKYTFLYDDPGSGQVSAVTGTENGPRQRSHILSADFDYQVQPWLSVGAKYGVRVGEVDFGVQGERDWALSSAHLAVVRTDLHFIKKWDLLLEARMLASPEADTTDFGTFVAVYRHLGENFKAGVGYNFGSFSDDLRDLTLDDEGVIFNLVGKF